MPIAHACVAVLALHHLIFAVLAKDCDDCQATCDMFYGTCMISEMDRSLCPEKCKKAKEDVCGPVELTPGSKTEKAIMACQCLAGASDTNFDVYGKKKDDTANYDACSFPASASVALVDRSAISVMELGPGHRLLSVDVSPFGVVDSEVRETDFVWEHHQFDEDAATRVLSYRVISHKLMQKPLAITSRHMLAAQQGCQGKSSVVPAQELKIGDCVLALTNMSGATETLHYAASEVTRITEEDKVGRFSPLTKSGTLVVDGVVVTSYTDTADWGTVHGQKRIYRVLHDVGVWKYIAKFRSSWGVASIVALLKDYLPEGI